MKTSKLFLMGTLFAALFMAVPTMAGVPRQPFTGDVEVDFDPDLYEVLVITDPSVKGPDELRIYFEDPNTYDPNDPNTAWHISGWNIKDLRLAYDPPPADILYVGVNSYGTIGDVDGDGFSEEDSHFDPDEWNDFASLGGGESVAVYFDLNFDEPFDPIAQGNWDIIAGVSAGDNCSGFVVATTLPQLAWNPGSAFGTPLPYHYAGAPTPTCPSTDTGWEDYEFVILHFSELWDTLNTVEGSFPKTQLNEFRVGAFGGSQNDGNVGEDYLYYHQRPSTMVTIVASELKAGDPPTVDLTVTEKNDSPLASLGQYSGPNSNTTGLPFHDVEVYVTANGAPLVLLGYDSHPPNDGDVGSDKILDIGEIFLWDWRTSELDDVNVPVVTKFEAFASGVDPAGFPHDFVDDLQEYDFNDVNLPPCVEVTKDVNCWISKAGDMVTYEYCIKNCGQPTIVITDWFDTVIPQDVIGNAILAQCPDIIDPSIGLDPNEECCFYVDFVIPKGDPFGDPIKNEFSVKARDINDVNEVDSNLAQAIVDIVHPCFFALKDCRTEDLAVGDVAIFDIYIENCGDVCLYFDLYELGDPCSFELPAGAVKEWETHILVETEEDIFNNIIGTVTLIPARSDPNLCGEPTVCLDNIYYADVNDTCKVGGGATRTPGYWKTHYYMAECLFNLCYPDGIDFGWIYVNNVDELMAIFHAKKAHLNKLCQARLQLSFHLGAAILNNCLPNGLPFESFTGETFEGLAAVMAGCDIAAIKAKIGVVGSYNEYGDEVEIIWPEGMCDNLVAYNATPQVSKQMAEGLFDADACEDCGDLDGDTVQGKGKRQK